MRRNAKSIDKKAHRPKMKLGLPSVFVNPTPLLTGLCHDRFLHCDRARHETLQRAGQLTNSWSPSGG
jgi:hypothetical protein